MIRLYLVHARQAFLPLSYISKPRQRLHSEGLSSLYKAPVLIPALRNKNKTPPASSSPPTMSSLYKLSLLPSAQHLFSSSCWVLILYGESPPTPTPSPRDLTDINLLRSYIHLRYVDISENHLTDLSPLNCLTHLLWLKADGNQLQSARMNELPYLQIASFSFNQIVDTEGIFHPRLGSLDLKGGSLGRTTQNFPS